MKGMRFKKKDGRFKDENCLKNRLKTVLLRCHYVSE